MKTAKRLLGLLLALVMVLGMLGYASLWAAVFADSGVALLCVANAVRLLYKKRQNPCEPNSPQL